MKYFIALSLIFTTSLVYAQQQTDIFPPACINDWWIEAEIEDMENIENLFTGECPDRQSPLEVAFDTYFSELLFSQSNPAARERLYPFLFGVVMRSDRTMSEGLQSEYERYFDLFSHVVKLHVEQVLATPTVTEGLDQDAFDLDAFVDTP